MSFCKDFGRFRNLRVVSRIGDVHRQKGRAEPDAVLASHPALWEVLVTLSPIPFFEETAFVLLGSMSL